MPYNWPTKIARFGITCPFQRILVVKYENMVDWNGAKIDSAESLDRHIRECMLPALARRLDPKDKKSHYCRRVDLSAVLANPAAHFDEIRQIAKQTGEDEARAMLLERINREKKEGFESWWTYLTEQNPVYVENAAFQYLLLRPVLETSNAKCTRQPYPLDAEAVAKVFDGIAKETFDPEKNLIRTMAEITAFGGDTGDQANPFGTDCVWVTIPSGSENGAQRVAALSRGSGWCVASESMAASYLQRSDFHLLVENGKAVAAIRTSKHQAVEIQGKLNRDPGDWWPRILAFLKARGIRISDLISHRTKAARAVPARIIQTLSTRDTPASLANHLQRHPAHVQYLDHERSEDEQYRPILETAWEACIRTDPFAVALAPEWMQTEATVPEALIQNTIKSLEQDCHSVELFPAAFISRPCFKAPRKKAWVSLLHIAPETFTRLPADLCDDHENEYPEFREAWISGWAAVLETDSSNEVSIWGVVPRLDSTILKERINRFEGCPPELYEEPKIRNSLIRCWGNLITEDPRSIQDCPGEFQQLAFIKSALRKGWVKLLENNPDTFPSCPADVQQIPEVQEALERGEYRKRRIAVEKRVEKKFRSLRASQRAKDTQAMKEIVSETIGRNPYYTDRYDTSLRFNYGGSISNQEAAEQRGLQIKKRGTRGNYYVWAHQPTIKALLGANWHPEENLHRKAWEFVLSSHPDAWEFVPDLLLEHPDLLVNILPRLLKEEQELWETLPRTFQESPLVYGILDRVHASETRDSFEDPDPSTRTELKENKPYWVAQLRSQPTEWTQCSEVLQKDPQIMESRKRGWCKVLERRRSGWQDCPEDLHIDHEIEPLLREAWTREIEEHVEAWKDCPTTLKEDPSVQKAHKLSWLIVIRNMKSGWLQCPDHLLEDKEIRDCFSDACLRFGQNPEAWDHSPMELQRDFRFQQASKTAWIREVQQSVDNWNKCPKPLREDASVQEAHKDAWVSTIKKDRHRWERCPTALQHAPEIFAVLKDACLKTVALDPSASDIPECILQDQDFQERLIKIWRRNQDITVEDIIGWHPFLCGDPGLQRKASVPIIRALRNNPAVWLKLPEPFRAMENLQREAAETWLRSRDHKNEEAPPDLRARILERAAD